MTSSDEQTAADVTRALARLADPQQRAYFFERLNNPSWVSELRKQRAFDSPPSPMPGDREGYVMFPPWPEGDFLVRTAERAPQEVVEVLRHAGQSMNPIVTRALLGAALNLPEEQMRSVLPLARQWAQTPRDASWYVDTAVDLAVRGLRIGEIQSSLRLVDAVLRISADPTAENNSAPTDGEWRRPPQPVIRMSEWEYTRVVGALVDRAMEVAPRELLAEWVKLLKNALWHSRWDDQSGDDDHSIVWRPAIGDHQQNLGSGGLRDGLVEGVRNALMWIANERPAIFEEVVKNLLEGPTLLRRIGLHALANTGSAERLAASLAADRRILDDYRLTHEVAELLDATWLKLEPAERAAVLEWIEDSDAEEITAGLERIEGTPPTREEVLGYVGRRQRDRYSYIARHLGGDLRQRHSRLIEQFGPPVHPEFLSWSSSWVGAASPIEPVEIERMPFPELTTFLEGWSPSSERAWPHQPTVEGLAESLSAAARVRVVEFAENAVALGALDPTYLRAVFAAFEAAAKDGFVFPWEPVLELASLVAERPFEPDAVASRGDRDPGFRWARAQVSRTLVTGIRENLLPVDAAHAAWSVLDRLADDPNPSPEYEAEHGGENMDPFTLALNTNRCVALQGVVEFGLWMHRNAVANGVPHPSAAAHFPNMLRTLDRHLDPVAEPSQSVRSVYGRSYPWLLLLDHEWASSRREAIFGQAGEPGVLGAVAWDTYIVRTPPYDSAFESLRPWYEAAIGRLPERDSVAQDRSPHVKLGEHLVTSSWRGADSGLTTVFLAAASDDVAAATIEFVGRALANTSSIVDTVRRRIQALWDGRLPELRADPVAHEKELRAFATWFISLKLDRAWSLQRLEEAARLGGAVGQSSQVLEVLARDAGDPVAAFRLLELLVRGSHDPWEHVLWREHARVIVSRIRDEPELRESVRFVVDYFVQAGDLAFRDLRP